MPVQVFAHEHPALERSVQEESVNQLTHGLGLLLAIVGSGVMLPAAMHTGDVWRIAGVLIYCVTLVALYAASTLSHSFPLQHSPRHFWRTVDQVCIFFLIAGTITPFGLMYLRTGWLALLTPTLWIIAIVGAWYRVRYGQSRAVSSAAYVLMGWLPIGGVSDILQIVPHPALVWMLIGGILYTVGTLFLATDQKFRHFHAVWHLMVVAASACHFWAIYAYVATV